MKTLEEIIKDVFKSKELHSETYKDACREVAKLYAKAKLEEAAEKIGNRYAIALVFKRDEHTKEAVILRSLTTDASSREEALGKAIMYFEDETEGYSLAMKTVMPAYYKDSITNTPLD